MLDGVCPPPFLMKGSGPGADVPVNSAPRP
jgi:hypothetical protein